MNIDEFKNMMESNNITSLSTHVGFEALQDTKNIVADGLTPKELYEKAEKQVNAGSIEQAIDQLILHQPYLQLAHKVLLVLSHRQLDF